MKKPTIMVTGNLGYIGSTMVPVLTNAGYRVVGYDAGFYEDCYLKDAPQKLLRQIKKDTRDVEASDLEGIDCVLHLAALSTDPLGELNHDATMEINLAASVRLAECARAAGVRRFVYTSSQSIYGFADTSVEMDEEGEIAPMTAYAKSKWEGECELRKRSANDFIITYLRPSTAYGASPNQRCDIVLNAFVAYAYTSKLIEIKSDGTPWRSMTHIRDITEGFKACLEAPEELVSGQVFNVGRMDNNYTVRQMAEAAQRCVPGTELTFTGEHKNPASYRVSAKKINTRLAEYYKPQWDIISGAKEMKDFFASASFDRATFDSYKCNRLQCIKKRIAEGTMTEDLRVVWEQR